VKVRVVFSKFGPVKFIGHLDIMRFFQKAIRAAGIPVKYTEGFSPHQVLSFAAPLGVGVESEREYFDLELVSLEGKDSFIANLNAQMCEGMQIKEIYLLPEKEKNAMASVKGASYRITFENEDAVSKLNEAVEAFEKAEVVNFEKETKTGVSVRNLKEAVYAISSKDGKLYFTCDASSGGNLKPGNLLKALFEPFGISLEQWEYHVVREEVYKDDAEGKPVSLIFGFEEI